MSAGLAERYRLVEAEVGGVPCKLFADNHACLSDLFAAFDRYAAHGLAVLDGRTHTYQAIGQCAARLAAHLAECLVGVGVRVGLALPNAPEWMVAFIALAALGAVPVLINPRAAKGELQHALQSTDCALCFGGGSSANGGLRNISLEETARVCASGADAPLPRTPRAPQDEAMLMFTSGTTGHAKAAVLTHLGVMTALKTIEYSGAMIAMQMAEKYGVSYQSLVRMRPPPVTLLAFPLFHVSGCHAVFLSALAQGGKLVLLPRWDAELALQLIAQEKVTAFPGVPTMHWDVLRAAHRERYDVSSLTSISIGGQGAPPALLKAMHEAFPGAVLGSGYGMTECNGAVTLTVGDEFLSNPTAAGKVVATMEVQIRAEDGTVLAAGEVGEIYVRGAALMSGYANASGSAFDADGWFASGDIGSLDANNCLTIVDRRTDMVICGGENIYCTEVERALDLHPAVRESAAFGLPDSRLGERLVALVVLHPSAAASSEDILAAASAHLAKHKVPRHIRLSAQPLPRNPSGKIVKRSVRQRYLALEPNP